MSASENPGLRSSRGDEAGEIGSVDSGLLTSAATVYSFLHEADAYALLARAGWAVPRHGWLDRAPPFAPGEPIVLKGIGEALWHKSELGAVHFGVFAPRALAEVAQGMRDRIEAAGHRWIGALVSERVAIARAEGLPAEGFVSLTRHEAGWIAVVGCGGLQAEELARHVAPLRWPLALVTPAEALAEFEEHFLGRLWLGRMRGRQTLTTRERLAAMIASLWPLAAQAEAAGLALLELNPVVLDAAGEVRPLDAVGRHAPSLAARLAPPREFLDALTQPQRVAIAGVSAHGENIGRIVLEKLSRCPALDGGLVLVKPGQTELLGVPCVPNVAALRAAPVDLLLLALPAATAARMLTDLIAQGGGARVVALIASGLGDGADAQHLGESVAAELRTARAAGRWTPTVLGPNFLGHWVPARGLDSSFIPEDKLPPHTHRGGLALFAQSGAFILCRRSRNPRLRLCLAVALGNQLDAALPDFLHALADDPECRAIAAYVEGFAPGHLAETVAAALKLRARGVPLVMLRAGRTAAGQAAAASHTGAMAGDLVLEREVLGRAGVKFAATLAEFDAALAWLSVFPAIRPGPLALVTNAGVEAVNASDLATGRQPIVQLTATEQAALAHLLAEENLAGVVSARVPLDLTPMARPEVFLRAAELLLKTDAAVLLLGLVPFTRNIVTEPVGAAEFARACAELSCTSGKPIGLIVDSGSDYEAYRATLAESGLPVFTRVEEAMAGLRVLAQL
ncbi:MAG: CoA-binding protein [Verrucomicrobia bacterium]|nr:CoA-binding protein [Verrucomicrobiota bacterium]